MLKDFEGQSKPSLVREGEWVRAVELFAGAGGLALGLSKAGFKPELVVERDRHCCDTLRINRTPTSPGRHWPDPFEGDVRAVEYGPFEGRIDLVSGGPPCQPFSIGGEHRGFNDTRDMWPEAVRAVREIRPRAFVFENVKGLLREAFSGYLGYVLLQLQHPSLAKREGEEWRDHLDRLQQHHTSGGEIEYRVLHELLDSANYGVAQRRHRVVFVGYRADIHADWCFPRPTHSMDGLLYDMMRTGEYWDRHQVAQRDRIVPAARSLRGAYMLVRPAEKSWRTVRDAISDLPDPEKALVGAPTKYTGHRLQTGAKSYVGHTGSPIDWPAKALKAGVHGVPGGENMLRRPDGTVRYFTVREAARLQGFPDGWQLQGPWSEAMRQLGNAVPMTLGEVVGKSVKKHLDKAST